MAKGASSGKSLAAIQKLLAERVQIEQWLERLDLTGDNTPAAVRQRVKADYQAKLKDVNHELTGYGSELSEALTRQRSTREGVARQEKEAAERLSESEVRHAVGEYDEAKWRDLHAEYLGALVRIREELKNADEEIERLEEVIATMKAPRASLGSAPPEEGLPPLAPPSAPTFSTSTSSSLGGQKTSSSLSGQKSASSLSGQKTSTSQPGQKASSSLGGEKPPGKQTDAFDELAFLKSVTDDEKGRPNASRASGQQRVPESIRPPGPMDEPDLPPPPPSRPPVDIGASGVASIDSAGPGKRLTAALDKSLKCKECGTMNLPTEWYCEKCGAELSESL